MDPLTHAVFGGIVSSKYLKTKTLKTRWSKFIIFIGMLLGAAPDLDLLWPKSPENFAQNLLIHRGHSHSFFFVIVAGIIAGGILYRIFRKKKLDLHLWMLLAISAMASHIILDLITSFGVAAFLPFSPERLGWNLVFVIDPVLSLGLLICLIGIFCGKNKSFWKKAGIGFFCFYIGLSFVFLESIKFRITKEYQEENISVDEVFAQPTPFNIVLWNIAVKSGKKWYLDSLHVFSDYDFKSETVSSDPNPLPPKAMKSEEIEALRLFSRDIGLWKQEGKKLYWEDPRFGVYALQETGYQSSDYFWRIPVAVQNDNQEWEIQAQTEIRRRMDLKKEDIWFFFRLIFFGKPYFSPPKCAHDKWDRN